MSPSSAFRRVALDRLSSAEELDRVLQVTSARSWILLTALCSLVGTAVVWGSVAVVPLKVTGQGILMKSGGIFGIASTIGGRVADISVAVGEPVKEGQVVARIAQPELVERLQQAKIRLTNLQAAHAFLIASGDRELQLQVASLEQRAKNLREAIAADETRVKFFREKSVSQQQLVNEGRLIRQTLINTIQELDAATERIRSERNELTDLELKTVQARTERQSSLQKSAFAIKEAETDVAQLDRALTAGTEVRSPYTGRILEIETEQGAMVGRGESLLTLDLTGRTVAELEAIVYVSAKDGKRISSGMLVQVAPVTVRPEEYGYLMGKVTYVSDLPATARGMMRVLKNQDLIKSLTGSTPPHEVHVDLLPDATTPSGYRWSSAKGPSTKIQSGTLCDAAIIVDTRRPIEMVVPFLRQVPGLSGARK